MSDSSWASSSPEPTVAALVVAAGAGRRMGATARKQYLQIDGVPLLLRALRPFLEHPAVGLTVVVLPPEDVDAPPAWLADLPVRRVAGGAERGDSVRNGLSALPPSVSTVLIHDGARPFVPREVIDRVLEAARGGAAIAALPVTDTVKEVDGDGQIVATAPRERLWLAQTPQGFPVATLREAHRRARAEGWVATDDAALCERLGVEVRVVEGDPRNLKVTRPTDLLLAEALARTLPHS